MSVTRGLHPPAHGGGRVYPVVWPAIGAPLDLTLLDVAWVWVPVHWTTHPVSRKRTSDLCQSFNEWCRCEGASALSWRGYCPAWNHGGRYLCVLNIDPATAHTFARTVGPKASIRLTRFKVARGGNDNFGPVLVTLAETGAYKWEGARPDIVPSLVHYYGADLGTVVRRVQEEGGEPC